MPSRCTSNAILVHPPRTIFSVERIAGPRKCDRPNLEGTRRCSEAGHGRREAHVHYVMASPSLPPVVRSLPAAAWMLPEPPGLKHQTRPLRLSSAQLACLTLTRAPRQHPAPYLGNAIATLCVALDRDYILGFLCAPTSSCTRSSSLLLAASALHCAACCLAAMDAQQVLGVSERLPFSTDHLRSFNESSDVS